MFELVTAYTETVEINDEIMKGIVENQKMYNEAISELSAIQSAVRSSSVNAAPSNPPIPELEIGKYISPLSVATQSATTD